MTVPILSFEQIEKESEILRPVRFFRWRHLEKVRIRQSSFTLLGFRVAFFAIGGGILRFSTLESILSCE